MFKLPSFNTFARGIFRSSIAPSSTTAVQISKLQMSTSTSSAAAAATAAHQIKFSSETPGPIEQTIAEKLTAQLKPDSLVIYNDSHKHAGHHGLRGATNVTESHFRIEIVSDAFKDYKTQPNRHRLVYNILSDELENKGVHALQLKTKTSEEIKKLLQK